MGVECARCHKFYKNDRSLKQHIKEACGKKSVVACAICEKCYSSQRSLYRHIKEFHIAQLSKEDAADTLILKSISDKTGIKNKATALVCTEEGCLQISFPSLKSYRIHIQNKHNKNLTISEHTFQTFEEFQIWKEETEKKLGITYSQNSGSKNPKKRIYYCRRSGKLRQKGFGKYKLKSQGSCKIGNYCLSTLELHMVGDIHNVKFYEDHSGHELNLQSLVHIPLPLSTKYLVASKLAQKVPKEEILQLVKQDNVDDRSLLITRQDITNIARNPSFKKFIVTGKSC